MFENIGKPISIDTIISKVVASKETDIGRITLNKHCEDNHYFIEIIDKELSSGTCIDIPDEIPAQSIFDTVAAVLLDTYQHNDELLKLYKELKPYSYVPGIRDILSYIRNEGLLTVVSYDYNDLGKVLWVKFLNGESIIDTTSNYLNEDHFHYCKSSEPDVQVQRFYNSCCVLILGEGRSREEYMEHHSRVDPAKVDDFWIRVVQS